MESTYTLRVPLVVDVHAGANWGAAHWTISSSAGNRLVTLGLFALLVRRPAHHLGRLAFRWMVCASGAGRVASASTLPCISSSFLWIMSPLDAQTR